MLFGSKKLIGLDIGSHSIKLVELEPSGRGYNLVSFGMVPTPMGVVNQGDITDTGLLASAIQGLIAETRVRKKNVATGLFGTTVIIKKITMPRVDKKVIADQVRFEAEQYIPFEINRISLTHKVLNSNPSPEQMDVLLIAAQNEPLFKYVETVNGAGLNCSVVDVNAFALANCFELNYGANKGDTIGLLNFGSEVTNFVVYHNGEVIFSRDIGVGGGSLTAEIHKSMGVTIHEAESHKISAVMGQEVPDEVHSIISTETERLVEEIRNSFEFFSASNSDVRISRCFYSGGASQMSSLVKRSSQVLGIPFEFLNPFNSVRSKKYDAGYLGQIAYFVPVAMGLATRQAGDA